MSKKYQRREKNTISLAKHKWMADGIITTFCCAGRRRPIPLIHFDNSECTSICLCHCRKKKEKRSVLKSSESLNRLKMYLWLTTQNESTKRYIKIWISTWTEKCCYLCTECHRWLKPKPVPALLHSHDCDYANASFRTEESLYSSSRLYFLKERIT